MRYLPTFRRCTFLETSADQIRSRKESRQSENVRGRESAHVGHRSKTKNQKRARLSIFRRTRKPCFGWTRRKRQASSQPIVPVPPPRHSRTLGVASLSQPLASLPSLVSSLCFLLFLRTLFPSSIPSTYNFISLPSRPSSSSDFLTASHTSRQVSAILLTAIASPRC